VAVSADGVRWFLINASPDLRAQIESFAPLQPQSEALRYSAIEAILLTNADLDHVLGLTLLREGGPVDVTATAAVCETLSRALRLDALLTVFCGVTWHEPAREFSPLALRDGSGSGLSCRAIFLPGAPPLFAGKEIFDKEGHSIAWQIADEQTGARLLIAPNVAEVTVELEQALIESHAVLFDGTFWSGDEMRCINPEARTADQMGHLPIWGGSLGMLRDVPARHRIYIHINNTNPILALGSRERAQVEGAGIVVGEDGMELEL
jgi:pyrroloquinoline quinone biosynthesis protein B